MRDESMDSKNCIEFRARSTLVFGTKYSDRRGCSPFPGGVRISMTHFPVVVNVTLWWKNCRVCGAKITWTLGAAQCRVVSGTCGGAPNRVFLPPRVCGGTRGRCKVSSGGPSGFGGTVAIRGGRWPKCTLYRLSSRSMLWEKTREKVRARTEKSSVSDAAAPAGSPSAPPYGRPPVHRARALALARPRAWPQCREPRHRSKKGAVPLPHWRLR